MYACTYLARKDNKIFRKQSYTEPIFSKKESPNAVRASGLSVWEADIYQFMR